MFLLVDDVIKGVSACCDVIKGVFVDVVVFVVYVVHVVPLVVLCFFIHTFPYISSFNHLPFVVIQVIIVLWLKPFHYNSP